MERKHQAAPSRKTANRHSVFPRNNAVATAAFGTLFIAILVMAAIGVGFLTPGSASAQTVTNICDRTPEMEQAILAQVSGATCSTVTETQLAGITSLRVTGYSNASIIPGDFAGLTALDELYIVDSPGLMTTPANAFSEVSSTLTTLEVAGTGLTTLHKDTFNGLSSVEHLGLGYNKLTSLDPDLFDGMASLDTVNLVENYIADLETGMFDDSPALRRINLSHNLFVRIGVDTFDGLTSLEELVLLRNRVTTVHQDAFDGLTSLRQIDLHGNNIQSLHQDTFDGLTSLGQLHLSQNQLTSIHEDTFEGLTSLWNLRLDENSISSLHRDTFDSLTSLEYLYLPANNLASLDQDLFDGLTNLRVLLIHRNKLASVHEGLFDGLTGLSVLALSYNELQALPAGLFTEPTSLRSLYLNNNSIASLDEDIFGTLTALETLALKSNSLSTLEEDVFDGLTNLRELTLYDNGLTSPHENLFDGLSNLQSLELHDNGLTSPHENLFDGLSNLESLELHDNGLASPHADLFDGLSQLSTLNLSGNSMTTLTAGLFDDLDDSLKTLRLQSNDLTGLTTSIFTGLTGMQELDLSCNQIATLGLNEFDPFTSTLTYLDISGNSFTTPITETDLRSKLTNTNLKLYTGTNTVCQPPTDIGIQDILLSNGDISPAFEAPGATDTYGTVDYDVTTTTITIIPNDPDATVEERTGNPNSIYDNDPNTPGWQVDLPGRRNVFLWTVRSKNALQTKNYALHIFREPPFPMTFSRSSLTIDEGSSDTYTVVLHTEPTDGVMIRIAAGGDVTTQPTSLSFTASNWNMPQIVTVSASDDNDDTDDTVTITHTVTTDSAAEYATLTSLPSVQVAVLDDDHPIVSATFGDPAASEPEGASVTVTVRLSQAPEREVVVPITATRGANLGADEFSGVPSDVTFAADATEAVFTVTFGDDAVVEGNETLTLAFGTLPDRVTSAGENPQLVLTVTDDDGPPAAPDVSVQTVGDGFVVLSWPAVANDSPVLRYEVRWRETDGGTFNAWRSVGLETSYRVEGLTNGKAHEFEVRAVNAHGNGQEVSASGTPTERLTGTPKAVQGLWVRATDSGRAELSWWQPANATDEVTEDSASATMSQIQGYRIEVCRTACDDEVNWYALVANTGEFEHRYTHQVLAPGVIRENRYRVRAININGKVGPWSNVATLDPTVLENVYLQTPDDSTLWVRFKVRNPDGNALHVRYENTGPVDVRDGNTGTGAVGYTEHPLTKKGEVTLVLSGLDAGSWYRVDLDFVNTFDSDRMQSHRYGTAREGETPLTSPYALDLLDAQVFEGGVWRDAADTALRVRMGETGRYRVRLKACSGAHTVYVSRTEAPSGALKASPMDADPLSLREDCDDDDGGPGAWREVSVAALALEDYPADTRAQALLRAPFAVVYKHEVWRPRTTMQSTLVSKGVAPVRILVERPEGATLPEPTGVAIGSENRVMSWDAVPGATGYLVEWRYGPHYSDRANQDRSLQAATSVTLPLGASGRGPITARVRAYSSSGVSGWVERTWDSRPPTLNVLDTAVNEDDGSVGFLVTLDPAATGVVTVQYTTVDATAVAPADYTATSGTVTFAPGETRKHTALVPIVNDGEEDTGETFRLVLSSPTGSDANNGAAVLGDAEAVATILNSEREAASLTGFTLVDAGTNADLMLLADGSTVELGELLASSYGIRAEMGAGAVPGSVRLALTGAKTVTATDDAAPWSLYGDGAGRVNGASLPLGSYTLRATAYADSGGRGDEQGSLEVSFTVAAGALGVTTPGPFTVAEGETAVAQLAASDTGTGATASWSIPAGAEGGADGAAFALTSGGVLSLVAAKDFEAPDDADGDGTYEVTVSVTAGAQTATAALSVTLADVDEQALSVTTAGPFTVAEGETAVAALAASDTGTGAEAVWSIPAGAEGGADGAAFSVTSEGVLSLAAAKDFEAPDDADGDGTYEVTVAAAVPASSIAGAQSATAALLVTLSDVNEAPMAQASASPERVREGARVTLDGSASTDPDAGDTLTYLWSQADDGAPRVTLSDASAEQPAFTSPSDLESETALGFTLGVTDAAGLHAEDTVTVTVTLISEVSISAASNYAAEGDEAVFRLTRTGSARAALTVPVPVEETGSMLGTAGDCGRDVCSGRARDGAAGADGGGRGAGDGQPGDGAACVGVGLAAHAGG